MKRKLIHGGLLLVALIFEGVGIVTCVRAVEHRLHRQLIPQVTVRIQYL